MPFLVVLSPFPSSIIAVSFIAMIVYTPVESFTCGTRVTQPCVIFKLFVLLQHVCHKHMFLIHICIIAHYIYFVISLRVVSSSVSKFTSNITSSTEIARFSMSWCSSQRVPAWGTFGCILLFFPTVCTFMPMLSASWAFTLK